MREKGYGLRINPNGPQAYRYRKVDDLAEAHPAAPACSMALHRQPSTQPFPDADAHATTMDTTVRISTDNENQLLTAHIRTGARSPDKYVDPRKVHSPSRDRYPSSFSARKATSWTVTPLPAAGTAVGVSWGLVGDCSSSSKILLISMWSCCRSVVDLSESRIKAHKSSAKPDPAVRHQDQLSNPVRTMAPIVTLNRITKYTPSQGILINW